MTLQALRLHPGADLRTSLDDYLRDREIDAAVLVSCVGSLSVASLRLAAAREEQHFPGPFEIVSCEGTLSRHGCHIHMAIADGSGQLLGGHLSYGSIVHTTAELVLVKLSDQEFRREFDSETGFNELKIRELE